MCFNSIH